MFGWTFSTTSTDSDSLHILPDVVVEDDASTSVPVRFSYRSSPPTVELETALTVCADLRLSPQTLLVIEDTIANAPASSSGWRTTTSRSRPSTAARPGTSAQQEFDFSSSALVPTLAVRSPGRFPSEPSIHIPVGVHRQAARHPRRRRGCAASRASCPKTCSPPSGCWTRRRCFPRVHLRPTPGRP